jgi:hypothetical protein
MYGDSAKAVTQLAKLMPRIEKALGNVWSGKDFTKN